MRSRRKPVLSSYSVFPVLASPAVPTINTSETIPDYLTLLSPGMVGLASHLAPAHTHTGT